VTAYGWTPGYDYRIMWWDWNLSPISLNETGWFDNMRVTIEGLTNTFGVGSVIVAHSTGNIPAYYFLTDYLAYWNNSTWKAANIKWLVSLANTLGGFFPAPLTTVNGDWTAVETTLNEAGTWLWPDLEYAYDGIPVYIDSGGSTVTNLDTMWGDLDYTWSTDLYNNMHYSREKHRSRPDGYGWLNPGVPRSVFCGTGVETVHGWSDEEGEEGPLTDFLGDGVIPMAACAPALYGWCNGTAEAVILSGTTHMGLLTETSVLLTWLPHALSVESVTW